MASISLNLGLLNLMPIPVLDGGHIFIMALEGLARRDFSMRVKEKMLLAGFVVLMMLMVTVIYNDLTRISWIERLMPWRVARARRAGPASAGPRPLQLAHRGPRRRDRRVHVLRRVRRRQEPRLELRRRRIDAAREHPAEERARTRSVSALVADA